MNQPSSDIVNQMERIRAKRSRRLLHLAEQTERLTDWREHVRAAPLAAFVASVLGGAFITKSIFGGRRSSDQSTYHRFESSGPAPQRAAESPRTPSRSLLSTVSSFVFPLVAAVARQQLLRALAQGNSSPSSAGAAREQKQSN